MGVFFRKSHFYVAFLLELSVLHARIITRDNHAHSVKYYVDAGYYTLGLLYTAGSSGWKQFFSDAYLQNLHGVEGFAYLMPQVGDSPRVTSVNRRTVGQDHQKCKETRNAVLR